MVSTNRERALSSKANRRVFWIRFLTIRENEISKVKYTINGIRDTLRSKINNLLRMVISSSSRYFPFTLHRNSPLHLKSHNIKISLRLQQFSGHPSELSRKKRQKSWILMSRSPFPTIFTHSQGPPAESVSLFQTYTLHWLMRRSVLLLCPLQHAASQDQHIDALHH